MKRHILISVSTQSQSEINHHTCNAKTEPAVISFSIALEASAYLVNLAAPRQTTNTTAKNNSTYNFFAVEYIMQITPCPQPCLY